MMETFDGYSTMAEDWSAADDARRGQNAKMEYRSVDDQLVWDLPVMKHGYYVVLHGYKDGRLTLCLRPLTKQRRDQ